MPLCNVAESRTVGLGSSSLKPVQWALNVRVRLRSSAMDSVPNSPGPLGTAYSARLRATWRRTSLLPATFLRAMHPLRRCRTSGSPVEPPDYRASVEPVGPGRSVPGEVPGAGEDQLGHVVERAEAGDVGVHVRDADPTPAGDLGLEPLEAALFAPPNLLDLLRDLGEAVPERRPHGVPGGAGEAWVDTVDDEAAEVQVV